MILATHNSLSSYQPKKWWMKILNPFAKCQNCDIITQWHRGVRMFDIRVRPHTGEAAHGLVTYDIDVLLVLGWLNTRAEETKEKVYIRLCCENRGNLDKDEAWFKWYWHDCKSKYNHLNFCGGYVKRGWYKLIDCKDPEYLELYRTFNVYKAKQGWKAKLKSIVEYVLHPTPKYWAKKDNAKYIEEYKDYQSYIMLDFVEYDTK